METKAQPLVSVVIATYNMARYLPLALRSALEQTYRNIDVLVIDDGSQDGTRDVMATFPRDPRLRYHFQPNRGQASAKNHGIREARGEYVAFLDADDMWMPDKLEQQIPLFQRSAALGVVHARVAYIDEAGNDLRIADNELIRGRVTGLLFKSATIGFGTCVAKRECFDRLGCFDESIGMGIDYDLWLRFSTEYEFDYVDRPLLRYRLWSGQMSNNCKSRYASAIAIRKRFLEKFPHFIDENLEKDGWAYIYVAYGRCLRQVERSAHPALRLYARALRHRPAYLPAWRAMLTTLIGLS